MRALNKVNKIPREEIFGVCKKFIEQLTYYFFMIIYLGTESFGNGYLFTELKENAPLIIIFGPMYIDFDEYPRYSDRTSSIFEKMLMKLFNVIIVMLILEAKKIVHMG